MEEEIKSLSAQKATAEIKLLISAVMFLLMLTVSGCMKDREPSAPVEIDRPRTQAIQPSGGMLVYPLTGQVKMLFNERMNLASFTNKFTLKDFEGNPVDGTLSTEDTTVIFTPGSPLKKATIYYASLKGNVKDIHNNSVEFNGDPVFNDSTVLMNTWFYTEGDYSMNGFYPVYLRDRKEGSLRVFSHVDSLVTVVPSFTAPEGMALSSDGQYIILVNTGKNEVVFISASAKTVDATIPVAANPSSVAVAGDYAFVTSVNGKAVSRINIPSKTLEASFPLNFFPGKLAVSGDGKVIYTFDQVKRDLYLINAENGSIIKKINTAVDRLILGEIRADNLTGDVYICDTKGLKIKRTDKEGNTALSAVYTFPAGVEPVDIVFNDTNYFVAAGKSVYKFDRSTNTLQGTASFSTNVKSLALIPTNELMYVTLATSIAIVDMPTLTVLKEKDLGSSGIENIISSQIIVQ